MYWWLWLILVVAWAGAGICIWQNAVRGGDVFGWLMGAVMVTVLAAAFALTLGGVAIGRVVDRNACHQWGVQNARVVKWNSYNWFTTGCVTLGDNGKWIPTGQVINNTPTK